MQGNGEVAKLPELTITVDPITQTVGFVFETKEFKTWDYVLAILEMAKLKAQELRMHAQMVNMQAAAQQQQVADQLQRKIALGR